MSLFDVLSKLKTVIKMDKQPLYEAEVDIVENTSVVSEKTVDLEYGDRCVLVGVVRNTYQFEVLLRKNFYHIPISQVNECQFPVKFIAIYQSKRFFGKNAGIRYFGEVESCSTVKRSDIHEIPKDSNEKYLYFRIKKWQLLDSAIAPKDMEFTAFSTTLYLLRKSHDSAELMLRTRDEHLFYKDLVKKVKMLVLLRKPDSEDVVYKDYTLKFKEGMMYIYFGDVLEYAVGYDIFLERPTDVIREIFDYYPEL